MSIDPAAAARLRRLGGDKLLRQMLELFVQLGPERMAAARAGLEGGELKDAERACHSLKSSAGNLGATTLQAAAGAAEDAAAAGSAAALAAALPALEQAYTDAETELSRLLAELAP